MSTPDVSNLLKRHGRRARDVEEVVPITEGHWVIKFFDGGELDFNGELEKVLSVFDEEDQSQ